MSSQKSIIYKILDYFVKEKSTDLHISWQKAFIRDKIWNLQKLKVQISNEDLINFSKEILTSEKFEILKNWDEVDFWLTYSDSRFRCNFYYDTNWLNIALRKIPLTIPTFDNIWLSNTLTKHYKKKKWLILVTWPTWSWKSTTMASIMKYIADNSKSHIITLEDPIEYIIDSESSLVNQREVWNNTKSWNNGIKYALRQDPDVVMVWEMRDLESIESALTLAETGHLVLSTLHTNDAVQTITRIINSFPANQQEKIAIKLSMTLELVISQRLLPTKDWQGKICAREILINNDAVANIIRKKELHNIYWVMELQTKSWMQTMDNNLAKLVSDNIVSIDEATSMIKDKESFKQLLTFYQEIKNKWASIKTEK